MRVGSGGARQGRKAGGVPGSVFHDGSLGELQGSMIDTRFLQRKMGVCRHSNKAECSQFFRAFSRNPSEMRPVGDLTRDFLEAREVTPGGSWNLTGPTRQVAVLSRYLWVLSLSKHFRSEKAELGMRILNSSIQHSVSGPAHAGRIQKPGPLSVFDAYQKPTSTPLPLTRVFEA